MANATARGWHARRRVRGTSALVSEPDDQGCWRWSPHGIEVLTMVQIGIRWAVAVGLLWCVLIPASPDPGWYTRNPFRSDSSIISLCDHAAFRMAWQGSRKHARTPSFSSIAS